MTVRTVTGRILNLHGAPRVGDKVTFTNDDLYTATEHVPHDATTAVVDSSGNISIRLYCPATYLCSSGSMRFRFALPDDASPTTLEALHATSASGLPPTATNALQVALDAAALRGSNLSDLTDIATARTNLAVPSRAELAAEATLRSGGDTSLTTALTAESASRASGDTGLQTALTGEATSRATADTTLQANITAEATARATTDGTEATARAAGDTAMQAALTSEASSRATADTALSTGLSSHTGNTSNPHTTTASQVGAYTTAQADTLLAAKATTAALTAAVAGVLQVPGAGVTGQEIVYDRSASLSWRNVPSRNILDVIDVVASDHTAAVKAAFAAYPHWHIPPNTTVKLTEQLKSGTPACVVIPFNGSLTGQDRDSSKVLVTSDHASDTNYVVFLLDGNASNYTRQHIADLNIVGSATTPMTWTNGQCSIFYENDLQSQSVFRISPIVFERVQFSAYRGFPIHSEQARLMARFCSFIDCGNGFNVNGAGSSCERSYFERAEGCEMAGLGTAILFNIFKNVFNAAMSIGGMNGPDLPQFHGGKVMGNYVDGVSNGGVGIILASEMSDTAIVANYVQRADVIGLQVTTSVGFLTNGIAIANNHFVSNGLLGSNTRIGMYIQGDNCRLQGNRSYNRADITSHASSYALRVQNCAGTEINDNTLDASNGGTLAVELQAATGVGWGPGNRLNGGSSGILNFTGGSTFRDARYVNDQIVNLAADRAALVTDRAIYTTTSTANRTIALPSAVGLPGLRYRIRKVDSASGTVIVDANSTETIDGALTKVLSQKFSGCEIESDGANWHSADLDAAPTEKFDFTADGDRYYVAPDTLTFALAQTAGTGTLTYTKALAVSPTTFTSTTLAAGLAAGDILKISATGVSGYLAISLRRVA